MGNSLFPTHSRLAQITIASLIITLLIATRGHQPLIGDWLPVSTIALFFLLGVYVRHLWVLTIAFALLWLMDISGLTWEGAGDFCLSSSYLILLLSYATYWAGGRAFVHYYRQQPLFDALSLTLFALFSALVGYLFITAGFYYTTNSEPQFASMLKTYFDYLPQHLAGLAFYLAVATALHVGLHQLSGQKEAQPS